jgi:hypothetical protein
MTMKTVVRKVDDLEALQPEIQEAAKARWRPAGESFSEDCGVAVNQKNEWVNSPAPANGIGQRKGRSYLNWPILSGIV